MSTESIILERIQKNVADFHGSLTEILASMPLSMSWIQREWTFAHQNHARALLAGAKIALLEAGTAWAIGSNRGAASSIRVFIENLFSWIYYKDHPIEYRLVTSNISDLMLPKAAQSYFKTIDNGFEKSYNALSKSSSRDSEYYYTVVSQFVHAHPAFAADHIIIEEAVISVPRDKNFLILASSTDEFISDNYAAYYRHSWDDTPREVQDNIAARLGGKLKNFLD